MSDTSARLALPYIQPAQAQKHVTHNEALRTLDALVQMSVEAFDATTPPAAPDTGAVWALGDGATGAWEGRDQMLALWTGTAWDFTPQQDGWTAVLRPLGTLYLRTNGVWSAFAAADLDNLEGLGINAASDATNRLAVAAEASLFSHEGSGHQIKINKSAAPDTASVLYQTGFSGRAEMGLAGSDDFSFKVSADGAIWNTALSMDAATGKASAPAGLEATGLEVTGLLAVNGPMSISGTFSANGMQVSDFSGGVLGALVAGSDFGTLVEGQSNGHMVLGVRGNNIADSVTIVSGGGDFGTDEVYDTVIASFQANGTVGIGRSNSKRLLHVNGAIRLDPTTEPAAPSRGDIYFDSATNILRCYDGTSWRDMF